MRYNTFDLVTLTLESSFFFLDIKTILRRRNITKITLIPFQLGGLYLYRAKKVKITFRNSIDLFCPYSSGLLHRAKQWDL